MLPVIAVGVGIFVLLALVASKGGEGAKPSASQPYDKPVPTLELPGPSPSEVDKSIDKDIEEVVKETETKGQEGQGQLSVITTLNINSLKSPIPGVNDGKWQTYVQKSISAKQGTVSKGYNLGMFLIGMRLLEDLGYAKDVKKQLDGTWKGTWVAPYSLKTFLEDANLQYEVFVKMTARDYNSIIKRYQKELKMGDWMVNRKIATVSGLMGVSKQAGLSGLDKWLKESPAVQKPNTTAAFVRTNGIF